MNTPRVVCPYIALAMQGRGMHSFRKKKCILLLGSDLKAPPLRGRKMEGTLCFDLHFLSSWIYPIDDERKGEAPLFCAPQDEPFIRSGDWDTGANCIKKNPLGWSGSSRACVTHAR